MRSIEVVDSLNVRFPGRDREFDLGLEMGIVLARMALGEQFIERSMDADAIEQIRPLAEKMGYVVVGTEPGAGMVDVVIRSRSIRAKLSLVR